MQDQKSEAGEPKTAVTEAASAPRPVRARKTAPKRPVRRKAAKAPRKKSSATSSAPKSEAPAPRQRVSHFVVLFRHGIAEERAEGKQDADRSLTADGHAKTRRAARGVKEIFPDADTLFASPLLRAMQTALWVTKAYGDKLKIKVTDALLPAADPARLAELIASQEGRNVIVVGHEPHLTESFAHLAGIKGPVRAELGKAGCIGIRLDEHGNGTLEWMLTPRMLRRLR